MDSSFGRSDPRPLTAEEDAIKLNTDCVYFLASPLTCKKGSECEYRHSEGARLNPRDCRFWLSGNCLNPKCLFRHPPLDGMVASPRTISGKIVTSSPVPPVPFPLANSFTYNLCRNNVPCHYYLKGFCVKGDKCTFMHGPPSGGNHLAKQNAKVSAQIATQFETSENDAVKIKELNNQQNLHTALNIGNVSADKLVNGLSSLRKGCRALENAPGSMGGLAISPTTYDPVRSSSSYSSSQNLHVQPDRHLLQGREAGEILEESSGVGYTELGRPVSHQPQSPSDHYQNAQAAEEVFRDSSPGFDVLVDHVRDADFFHEKDGFRSAATQVRRNVNLGDDYDHYHSDYEASTRLDRFRYDGAGEFQHYGNEQNSDDWNQRMISSAAKRIFNRPLLAERSSARRLRSPVEIDAADLRHQLRKQRRQNGCFSSTNSVRYSEPKHENTNDRYRTHNSYKDQHHRESTISSRLRGRIMRPKPPSPEIPSDLEDGRDRGRQPGRLSPVRQSGNHRSLGQRLGWRPIEESSANPRYFGRQHKTIDASDLLDFTGPRSLEELKGAKAVRSSHGQPTKYNHSTSSLEHNRVGSLKTARLRESEASAEFEGPKPLSVLLKRKRESGSVNDAISGVRDDRKAIVESEVGSFVFPPADLEVNKAVSYLEVPRVGAVEESLIPTEDEQINFEQKAAGDETEAYDAIEDEEEPDYTCQKDREYYYDTVEGADYKTEDDIDHIDVDLDADEDEDDFAKKVGLIFS